MIIANGLDVAAVLDSPLECPYNLFKEIQRFIQDCEITMHTKLTTFTRTINLNQEGNKILQ